MCNRWLFFFLLWALALGLPLATPFAQIAKTSSLGTLIIIGGGEISDAFRTEILQRGHWQKGNKIAVLTLASDWDSSFISINQAFRKITQEDCIPLDSVTIHDPAYLDSLREARFIYLGGGDQVRFMQRIAGTPVKKIIQEAYQRGATIAGTSAGASVMSRLMVTGTSPRDSVSSTALKGIWHDAVDYDTGLALLDSVIIDQHFVVRSRYNRLFTGMMDHPHCQAVGINESTAIVVQAKRATVIGESQVIVLQKPKGIRRLRDGNLGAQRIELAVYLPGDSFPILQ